MALPKLNEAPKYSITIPSTNKNVRFRPFLVKEEKVLLLAMESEDQDHILQAILDTITACVVDELNTLALEVKMALFLEMLIARTSKFVIFFPNSIRT